MILHCIKKTDWEDRKNKTSWGEEELAIDGFIHCSTIELFWRVTKFFEEVEDELVILCIDEDKLESEVIYEDKENTGKLFPHVYGLINNDAVVDVLPYLRNKKGQYTKNKEFLGFEDE